MGATGRDIVEQRKQGSRRCSRTRTSRGGIRRWRRPRTTRRSGERAELAWSDALADRELFAAVESARDQGASGDVGRRLELLYDAMLRHQVPDRLRERIVELESSIDLRFSRHRGVVGGSEVEDTEIKRILRRSDDPRSAERRGRRRRRSAPRWPTTCASSRAYATRRRASLGHRDWFALSLATDELDEGRLVGDACRGRPGDRRAVRALEGGARRAAGGALRVRRGPTSGHGTTPTRSSRRHRRTAQSTSIRTSREPTSSPSPAGRSRASASTADGIIARSDLYPPRRQEPARVLHRHRPSRRRPRAREPRVDPRVRGHDAARARSRRLRPRLPRRAAVAPPLDAPRRDRGLGDPVRLAGLAARLARARSRAERERGRRARAARRVPQERSSFSSSRAGCS